jgi:hypothetical protein
VTSILRTTAIMPEDFPAEIYDRVNERLAAMPRPSGDDPWYQFAAAWNAVAYRFLAVAQAEAELSRSFAAYGTSPRQPERSRQDLAIFALLTAGSSCIEILGYSLFAAAWLLGHPGFDLDTDAQQTAITLKTVDLRYNAEFPMDPIATVIATIRSDPNWIALTDLRDVEVHRANVGRNFELHVGSGPTTPDRLAMGRYGGLDVVLDQDWARRRRTWLARTVAGAVDQIDAFLSRQSVP